MISRCLGIGTIIAVAAISTVSCNSDKMRAKKPFIDPNNVVKITALCNHTLSDGKSETFEIDKKYLPLLLEMLCPASFVESEDGEEIARLTLFRAGGRSESIRFVFFGKEPLRWEFNGVQYLRSGPYLPVAEKEVLPEVVTFHNLLIAIHKNDQARITSLVDLFRRSRGSQDGLKVPPSTHRP